MLPVTCFDSSSSHRSRLMPAVSENANRLRGALRRADGRIRDGTVAHLAVGDMARVAGINHSQDKAAFSALAADR